MEGNFKRYFWISTGVILGSILVFGIVFYFLSQSVSGEAATIVNDRTQIAQRSWDLQNLSDLKNDSAQAGPLQSKINAVLPIKDNVLNFTQFVQNMARTHSLSLTFAFGNEVDPSGNNPGYAPFTATVEGDDSQDIESFLNQLETKTTQFLVNVDNVVFSPNGGGERLDFTGSVFYQADPAPKS